MKNRLCHPLSVLACLAMLTACTPFWPENRAGGDEGLPATFALFNQETQPATPWWHTFDSPELDRLVDEALTDSFSLKRAWAQLRQARARVAIAGASRYPSLEGSGTAASVRRDAGGLDSGPVDDRTVSLGLVSSYEIDLWGRVHSQHQAAMLDAAASEADLHTAAVTLAAEVTDRWVQILSQQLQKQLLEEQLANNLTLLELIELRFRNAMVSALDVYQQRQVVANVRAKIPLVEARVRLLHYELALLLGRPPRSKLSLGPSVLPEIERLPAVGLPVDLLAQRPDIRAAGIRLRAADWQLAEARANRLPALRLSAGAQYGPDELDLLFDTWLLRLAANLAAPIFDGGQRAAEVDRTRSVVDENLWAYRQVVFTAVKEVEDALESEARQHEHLAGLQAVRDAARNGLREAISRYRTGLSDYLPVLTQLLSVQDLERSLISQQEQLLRYRVGLYRALGGTWPADLLPSETNVKSAAGGS